MYVELELKTGKLIIKVQKKYQTIYCLIEFLE